jgi:hypothetical protein
MASVMKATGRGDLDHAALVTLVEELSKTALSQKVLLNDQIWRKPNGLPIRDRRLKAKHGDYFFGKFFTLLFSTGS